MRHGVREILRSSPPRGHPTPPEPPAHIIRTASAPNTCSPQILDAGGPGAAALTSWGVTAPALESKLDDISAQAGSVPASGHLPITGENENGSRGGLRQTALLGHEEIGIDHLLLALLDDHASTGAQILIDLAPLNISEMREHLQHQLAQQAHPQPLPPHTHPAQRRRIHPRPHRRPEPETSGPRPHPPTHSNNPNSRFSRG
ncbi:Clp protease N-terminal domain-containing protein [Rhodococcus sp. NPDC127530]|uniref:Clp protease N-terminal domain-containing protein n=1 Tax=unclassified Rhodococcus (in: high G+C Gram-positive bacteria) TaxID=192944 RepID=UPI00362D8345